MNGRYDDMIYLPHHVSDRRARMSDYDRAAQFSPFAALTGHDAAIRETARLTDTASELDENELELLNRKLLYLREHPGQEAVFTYFCPDSRKTEGHYETVRGSVCKIDLHRREVLLSRGDVLPMDRIHQIQGYFEPREDLP